MLDKVVLSCNCGISFCKFVNYFVDNNARMSLSAAMLLYRFLSYCLTYLSNVAYFGSEKLPVYIAIHCICCIHDFIRNILMTAFALCSETFK